MEKSKSKSLKRASIRTVLVLWTVLIGSAFIIHGSIPISSTKPIYSSQINASAIIRTFQHAMLSILQNLGSVDWKLIVGIVIIALIVLIFFRMKPLKIRSRFTRNYIYLIPFSIFIIKGVEILFRMNGKEIFSLSNSSRDIVLNIFQLFGVIYGVIISFILVRAVEQFNAIVREFDLEANIVRNIYEALFYLKNESANTGKKIAVLLHKYVLHVIKHYPLEVKLVGNDLLKGRGEKRIIGDSILEHIRVRCRELIYLNMKVSKPSEIVDLESEIIQMFNRLVDIRRNRINLSGRGESTTFFFLSAFVSSALLIPLYLISPTSISEPLVNFLVIYTTLLIVFIHLILEDLDEPFSGTWRISAESWQRLLAEMDFRAIEELGRLDKQKEKKNP